MALPEEAFTKDEPITHTDGLTYRVIDPSKLDFKGPDSQWGRKKALIYARQGVPGEVITNAPGGFAETPSYKVASENEIIFGNFRLDGNTDEYTSATHGRTLATNYKKLWGELDLPNGVYQPIMKPVRILHEAVDCPICIRNAYGEGCHEFLREGATLKFQDGKVGGIEKSAFDQTWSIVPLSERMPVIHARLGR